MTLTWTTDRDRFEMLARYEDRVEIKKAGFRWDPEVKKWWTGDAATAVRFEKLADGRATEKLQAVSRAIEDSRAASSDVDLPCPEGLAYRPFQKAGIAYALGRQSALIADEMGLGKTIQAIGVMNARERKAVFPALVVCPATLKLNWEREIKKWLMHDVTVGVAQGSFVPPTDIVIINYDILWKHREMLLEWKWRLLVADEAHYAKTLSFRKGNAWMGSMRAKALAMLAESVPAKLFLTGTPVANRPKDLWPLLAMLDPERWPKTGFFRYAMRYCNAHKEYAGRGTVWNFDGISRSDELQAKLRSTVMIRRLKTEVLKELPAKSRTMVTLPASKKALAAEAELTGGMQMALSDDWAGAAASLGMSSAATLAAISEARHQTALAKVGDVVQFCKEVLEAEEKLIVFAHHKDVVAGLREGLADFNPVTIVGDDTMKGRQESVDSFQTDKKIRVVIANMKAGGTGLTLTAARTVVFAELDWTPAVVTQAEDRAHRIGQESSVQVYHVVLDGSLDAMLAKMLVEKQDQADAALDDAPPPISSPPAGAEPPSPEGGSGSSIVSPVEGGEDPEIPRRQRDGILLALRTLASYCDGALARDGMGFNKFDTENGMRLAAKTRLDPKEAVAGLRIVNKYRRQLTAAVRAAAGVPRP